jgi:hypothetical protein
VQLDYGTESHWVSSQSILISECGKRELKNAFRKHWKKYVSVSVYENGKRETEKNGFANSQKTKTSWERISPID